MAQSMPPQSKVEHKMPGGGVESLPPAGDERREVLAKRADALEEKAEELGASGGAIREDAFRIENEIGAHFNEMEVPNARPEFAYKWEQRDIRQQWGNRHFLRSQALGWQKVYADDPDAKGLEHLAAPDGSIVVGDVILMRIPRGRYVQLRRQEYLQTQRMEQGVDSELQEKARRAGVRVLDQDTMGAVRPGWNEAQERQARQVQAQRLALQQLDQQIRQGAVPGRPVR